MRTPRFYVRKNIFITSLLTTSLLASTASYSNGTYHSQHTKAPIHFRMSVIDDNASGSYGLVGQDITKNGYTDLVSFAYTGTSAGQPEGEIYWYEFQPAKDKHSEPTWKKHLITKKKHVVQGTFMDVDHDGFEDLIFMSDFEVPIKDETQEGNIWWAKRPQNLNASQWETYWIGRAPGAHRIMTVDLEGTGNKQVVVVPLFGKGEKPIYGPANVSLFEPQKNPKLPWKKTTFPNLQLHATHDVIVVPKAHGSHGQNLLVGGKEGILRLSFYRDNQGTWQMISKTLHDTPTDTDNDLQARDKGVAVLGVHQNANWHLSGVTDISQYDAKVPFVATIDYTKNSGFLVDEPWHGDTVSIYVPKQKAKTGEDFLNADDLERIVLEKRTAGGHAVQVADFRGIGCPDVVAGFRAYPTAFMIYLCNQVKNKAGDTVTYYEKQIISERAANAIVIGNWNKNGLPDMATAGYGNEGDPYILMWHNMSKPMVKPTAKT